MIKNIEGLKVYIHTKLNGLVSIKRQNLQWPGKGMHGIIQPETRNMLNDDDDITTD